MKTLPYVYRLTHKVTGQFYIGYRCANKVSASEDLGVKYLSSSSMVKKMGFHNFDYEIIAEFFNGDDAYDFEQELIRDNVNDDLCLNKHYVREGNIRYRNATPHNDATKDKIRATRDRLKDTYNKTIHTLEHKLLVSNRMKSNNPMGGINPWSHPKTLLSQKALYAWSMADMMYSIYSSGGGYVKMAKSIGQDWTTTHQNIFRKFKSGWVPMDDPEWLTFKNCYEPVN